MRRLPVLFASLTLPGPEPMAPALPAEHLSSLLDRTCLDHGVPDDRMVSATNQLTAAIGNPLNQFGSNVLLEIATNPARASILRVAAGMRAVRTAVSTRDLSRIANYTSNCGKHMPEEVIQAAKARMAHLEMSASPADSERAISALSRRLREMRLGTDLAAKPQPGKLGRAIQPASK